MTRIAFLAPLKPPDHPEPSGDREMARLLMRALERAGCAVELASRLRMLDRRGDEAETERLAAAAQVEADTLIARWQAAPHGVRPAAVLTYHVHYKAPDVIGPRVAAGLGIPYLIAEGSRAPKRAVGPWRLGHELAEEALDRADAILVMNENDREMLERARPGRQSLPFFPPFIDPDAWPVAPRPPRPASAPLRLLAVAMMRDGDKLASYRVLAKALARVEGDWMLDIAGDGPARQDIASLFAPFGTRVRRLGLVSDRVTLAGLYAGADLLVWPAVREAYGMVFLEAALQGCPALAGRSGGVPGVVLDGRTGFLTPEGDGEAFAAQLNAVIAAPAQLDQLSREASMFVRNERSLERAALRLGDIVAETLGKPCP